jgi:hypothetical protein
MKLLKKWYLVAGVVLPVTFLRFFLFNELPGGLAVNVSYFLTGVLIFLPVLIYLFRNNFHNYQPILISVLCLSISLLFRRIDYSVAEFIPMGSHFLWHIFSGIGAFFLARYIYLIRLEEINQRS